ncbi:helix-turn-helix transcriptional regulator [Lysobacter antibioticus]|uniref:helix-turn-helix transcriptional regulator n=1 Tax=Lysobacter antibioticus TaxID=84531 RepID=UPI00034D2C77|nr:AraC family transcriptional regulator [Lysobacter antibioticus]
MSEPLPTSPPAVAAGAVARADAALGAAAVRDWLGARRLAFNRELSLAPGLDFAFAAESIAEPTQWRLQHDRHTLIVHLDGAMRRLETRIEGAGRLRLPPAAGDLWLIPAGRQYRGEALGGDIAYAEFNIDPARFGPCRDAAAGLGARMKHRDPFVHGLAARLAGLSGAGDELAAMLREALGQALGLHLLREYAAGAAAHAAPPPQLAPIQRRRIEDYIRAHLEHPASDRPIRLAALAQIAGLSVHRLLIAFRAAFGASPIQYVLGERLRRVCLRLRESDQDIATIAVEAGFASHSHLSVAFKKRYGVSPREYRAGAG